jgi:hypothetical protein
MKYLNSNSVNLAVDVHGGNGGSNTPMTGAGSGNQGAGGGGSGGVLWTATNFTGTVINTGGQGGIATNASPGNNGVAGTDGGVLTGLVIPEQPYDSLHPFIAVGDSVPSVVCLGSSVTLAVGGGAYGSVLVDGNNVSGVLETLSDTLFLPVTVTGTAAGVKRVCYVAYSANPDSVATICSDTVCYDITVALCHCDNITPVIARDSSAPVGTYVFYDANNIQANVLTWIVDGDTAERTTGNGTYTYQPPTAGVHVICMNAAYIRPVSSGYSECCYATVCDTIDYDNCELWRATDSISYLPNLDNYQNINFTYHGTSPTSITWNFGDGSAPVVNAGEATNHTYNKDGNYKMCAYIV